MYIYFVCWTCKLFVFEDPWSFWELDWVFSTLISSLTSIFLFLVPLGIGVLWWAAASELSSRSRTNFRSSRHTVVWMSKGRTVSSTTRKLMRRRIISGAMRKNFWSIRVGRERRRRRMQLWWLWILPTILIMTTAMKLVVHPRRSLEQLDP